MTRFGYVFGTIQPGCTYCGLDTFLDVSMALGETPDSYDQKIEPMNMLIHATMDDMPSSVERTEMGLNLHPSSRALAGTIARMGLRSRYAPGEMYLLIDDRQWTRYQLKEALDHMNKEDTLRDWLVGRKFSGYHVKSSRGRKLIA